MVNERDLVGTLFVVAGIAVTATILNVGQMTLLPMGLFLFALGSISIAPSYL